MAMVVCTLESVYDQGVEGVPRALFKLSSRWESFNVDSVLYETLDVNSLLGTKVTVEIDGDFIKRIIPMREEV